MLNPKTPRHGSCLDAAGRRFTKRNEQLVLQTRATLAKIVAKQATHAKFLNTLALLEHLGSRRIMETQHGAACAQPTLRHLAEEAGHAFFMKRQADKIGGRQLQFRPDELLAGAAARRYFRRLEALIHGRLARQGSAQATYLYMSMIIEIRALWFYRIYQQALNSAGSSISLKRILGEEANHLNEMAERLEAAGELGDERVAVFVDFEHRLYSRLLAALKT